MRSRQAVLAVAALALLAAAVVASGARGGTLADRRLRVPDLGGVAALLFVLAVVAGFAVALAGIRRGPRATTPRRARASQLLPIVLAVAAVAAWALRDRGADDAAPPPEDEPAAALGGAPESAAPTAEGREVALVLVLLGAGAALAVWTARRRASTTPQPVLAQRVGELLADLAGDLEFDPEPRLAVIRAYRRLEDALAGHGLGRLATEAPREYLRRVVGGLSPHPPSEPLRRLTALFERAMFSTHPIDEAMRADAVAALRQVGAALRTAAAVP